MLRSNNSIRISPSQMMNASLCSCSLLLMLLTIGSSHWHSTALVSLQRSLDNYGVCLQDKAKEE
jgi:hypothetical protein